MIVRHLLAGFRLGPGCRQDDIPTVMLRARDTVAKQTHPIHMFLDQFQGDFILVIMDRRRAINGIGFNVIDSVDSRKLFLDPLRVQRIFHVANFKNSFFHNKLQ